MGFKTANIGQISLFALQNFPLPECQGFYQIKSCFSGAKTILLNITGMHRPAVSGPSGNRNPIFNPIRLLDFDFEYRVNQ
jgi:hypothetical protein